MEYGLCETYMLFWKPEKMKRYLQNIIREWCPHELEAPFSILLFLCLTCLYHFLLPRSSEPICILILWVLFLYFCWLWKIFLKWPYWKWPTFWTLKIPFFFLKMYFLFEREKQRTHTCEEGRVEGEGESQAGSMLNVEPDLGLDFSTLRSQPELKSRLQWSTDCQPGVRLIIVYRFLIGI